MRSHGSWNWVLRHFFLQLPSKVTSAGLFRDSEHLVAIKVPEKTRNMGVLSFLSVLASILMAL